MYTWACEGRERVRGASVPVSSVGLAGLKRCRLRGGGTKNRGEPRLMSWEKNMTGWRLILVLSVVVGVGTLSGPAFLQERLVTGANPYQVVEDWMQPFADGG